MKEKQLEIMLRNKVIPSIGSTQFLGITRQQIKLWEHINKLRAKAKRALHIIKVVVGKKWGGDRKTLKKTVQCNI